MSYTENIKLLSYDADSSIALFTGISGMPGAASPNYGHMYSAVKLTGSHTVGLATGAANERVIGILMSKPQKLGTAASVASRLAGGVCPMIAGTGGVAAGDPVKVDASGHGVTATLPGDVGVVIGYAVEAAAAGSLFPLSFE